MRIKGHAIKRVSVDAPLVFSKILSPTIVEINGQALVFFGGVLDGEFKSQVYAGKLSFGCNNDAMELTQINEIEMFLPANRRHDGICPSHVFKLDNKLFIETASFVLNYLPTSPTGAVPYRIQSDIFELSPATFLATHKSSLSFFHDSPHLFECGASVDTKYSFQYFVHGTEFLLDACRQKYVPSYRLFRRKLEISDGVKIEPVLDETFYETFFGVSRITFHGDFGYFAARKLGNNSGNKTEVYRIDCQRTVPQMPERMHHLTGLNFPHLYEHKSGLYCFGSLGHMGDGGIGGLKIRVNAE